MRHCCFALAAPVLLVAVLLALPGASQEGTRCLKSEECVCPPGIARSWCYDGLCFGGRADGRCVGQANGHKLDEGTWCWDGLLTTLCAVGGRQSPLGQLNNLFMQLLESVGGPFYGKALPLLARMWLRADDKAAQIQGCNVLSHFGWNVPESKEPLMRLGAIDLAVFALKRFQHDRMVEDPCINSMAALSLYNRPVSLRVGELGGVEMTANYWIRNFDDPRAVVANYFGCYQDYSPENRERMRKAGAIRLAFDACGEGGKFFWNANVQFSCWCGFSSFHSEENHAEFRRLGGMRHTYVVFRDHGKSYRVREEILQAMKGICAYRANRDDLAKEGFMDLLADAVKTEKRDPQIQSLGLETLRMFVESNVTLRSRLIELGGVDFAFAALEMHAAKLIDTRSTWDSQNVYGELNDNQYNVPGGAAEILYSLVKHGPETREAMVASGAIGKLDAAIEATQSRVPSVKYRTLQSACQVLFLLKEAAEAAGRGDERKRVARLRGCSERPESIKVITNDAQFEP